MWSVATVRRQDQSQDVYCFTQRARLALQR